MLTFSISFDDGSDEAVRKGALGDDVLLGKIRSGEEDALVVIYRRHSRRIYSLIRHIVGSEPEAEEVLQDVFLHLWQHASHYDEGRGSLLSWLLVIAHSRSVDRLRSRLGLRVKRHEVYGWPVSVGYQTCSLETTAESLERAQLVGRFLLSLPPEQREVIELGYFQGLSQSEIAERLHEPLGTIKGRTRLALQKLRACAASGSEVAERQE